MQVVFICRLEGADVVEGKSTLRILRGTSQNTINTHRFSASFPSRLIIPGTDILIVRQCKAVAGSLRGRDLQHLSKIKIILAIKEGSLFFKVMFIQSRPFSPCQKCPACPVAISTTSWYKPQHPENCHCNPQQGRLSWLQCRSCP